MKVIPKTCHVCTKLDIYAVFIYLLVDNPASGKYNSIHQIIQFGKNAQM